MKQIKKDTLIHYFPKQEIVTDSVELGSLELRPSYPFIVSGGRNTERYYFKHVSKITDYKFNVRPEYFGDESSYVDVFPERIKRILAEDADAKIFCGCLPKSSIAAFVRIPLSSVRFRCFKSVFV